MPEPETIRCWVNNYAPVRADGIHAKMVIDVYTNGFTIDEEELGEATFHLLLAQGAVEIQFDDDGIPYVDIQSDVFNKLDASDRELVEVMDGVKK